MAQSSNSELYAVADFCLTPMGTGEPSVGPEIAECQRVLEKSGLTYKVAPVCCFFIAHVRLILIISKWVRYEHRYIHFPFAQALAHIQIKKAHGQQCQKQFTTAMLPSMHSVHPESQRTSALALE
ncbi:unnamed protein product [Rhizoctonia solani]|uniref:Thiamine-binding protein domain-containing protein n=1 Tax=Rhizoctonia solani TaxID=456999 RepID=A0A8H3E2X7_9AGAM|nr:unnamed protein product [Rhizoctonia solani]